MKHGNLLSCQAIKRQLELSRFIEPVQSRWYSFQNKARLDVKGYSRIPEVDYGDTFAPVAWHDTIRLLLAFAGYLGWKVFYLDVKLVFLNGTISKKIFVDQLEGFIVHLKKKTWFIS